MKPDSKIYQGLVQERADIVAEGRRIFELAEQGERELTVEEKARDDAINLRLAALDADLGRHEQRRARELGAPAVLKIPRGDSETKALAHFVRTGDSGSVRSLLQPDEAGKMSVTLNLPSYAEQRSPGYQAAVIDSTNNITTAADGLNMVPIGLVRDVVTRKNESDLTQKLGLRPVPGKGTTVNYPYESVDPEVFATTAEQTDAHNVSYERDSGSTLLKAFTLVKKTRKVELTEEIMEDEDVNLMAYIADRIGRQIAKTHNTMLLAEVAANGTALRTYASATAIAAGDPEAIVFNNTLAYYLEDGGSPAWVTLPSTFGAIATISGNPRLYAETPAGSVRRQLMEYPVYFSSLVAAPAASAKDLFFGNWDYVGWREAPELRFIMDPYSVDGLVILKYSFRAVAGVLQAGAVGYGVHPSA